MLWLVSMKIFLKYFCLETHHVAKSTNIYPQNCAVCWIHIQGFSEPIQLILLVSLQNYL